MTSNALRESVAGAAPLRASDRPPIGTFLLLFAALLAAALWLAALSARADVAGDAGAERIGASPATAGHERASPRAAGSERESTPAQTAQGDMR